MSKNKKVIITAANGQDGSNMVDFLLEATNNDIVGTVRRTSQPILNNLTAAIGNPRFRLELMDLNDPHSIDELIKKENPDYFINFGASAFVPDSWNSPAACMQTNSLSLIHILESVRKYNRMCRVYSSGSSEQFGNVLYSPQDEKHPMNPRSIYGVSKCAASHICKVYRESYGLFVVHGLLYNHEGLRRQFSYVTRKITSNVARIFNEIQNNLPITSLRLGELDARRDWSDSVDFMDGIWRMINQEKYNGKIEALISQYDQTGKLLLPRDINPAWHSILVKNINEYILSSGETHTIREFCEIAFEHAGFPKLQWEGKGISEKGFILDGNKKKVILIEVDKEFYRPADVMLLHGDSSRARKELGWKPKISFIQLVQRMVENDLMLLEMSK